MTTLEQLTKPERTAIIQDLINDAWENGDIFYKLQDHQEEIYDFIKSRKNLTCSLLLSRRFGKTHVCFIEDTEDCLKKTDTRIAYFYPTLKQGKHIIFPIAETVFEDAPANKAGVWSEMESCYQFPNGARIYLFGCDTMRDIDRHRGPKYTKIRIDECGVHSYLNYLYKSVLLPTLLTTKTQTLITFMGTPSPVGEHDFKNIFESCCIKGDAIVRTIEENTSLSDDKKRMFIEESGGYDSTEVQREYYCRWVIDSDFAVIPEWRDHFIQEVERDDCFQFYKIYASMDIGGRDKTAIIWGYYDFKKGLLVIENEEILTGAETTIETMASAIKPIELSFYDGKQFSRVADNNGVIILQDLGINHGIHFNPIGKKDTKQAMVGELRIWINAGRILIHPRCTELIGCLRSAVWDKTKSEFQRSGVYGHFDALDALIYLVRTVDDRTNPIPWNYGLDTTNIHRVERLRSESGYDKLAKAMGRK